MNTSSAEESILGKVGPQIYQLDPIRGQLETLVYDEASIPSEDVTKAKNGELVETSINGYEFYISSSLRALEKKAEELDIVNKPNSGESSKISNTSC